MTFNTDRTGQAPYSGLTLDSKGMLYGTTQQGGANECGLVFAIAPGADGAVGEGEFITLASFHGWDAYAASIITPDSHGDVFATTPNRGAGKAGTVFEIVAGSGKVTTLVEFSGPNGKTPNDGVVIDGNGNIYGTTRQGGANDGGTVFKLTRTGGPSTP